MQTFSGDEMERRCFFGIAGVELTSSHIKYKQQSWHVKML
jgi:hypothetical protein